MNRFLLYLTLIISFSSLAQTKKLKEFGPQIFEVLKKRDFEKLKHFTINEEELKYLYKTTKGTGNEDVDFYKKSLYTYRELIDMHQDFAKQKMIWELSNYHSIHLCKKLDENFHLVALVFEDNKQQKHAIQMALCSTKNGLKVFYKKLRSSNFDDVVVNTLNEKGIRPIHLEHDFTFKNTALIDSINSTYNLGYGYREPINTEVKEDTFQRYSFHQGGPLHLDYKTVNDKKHSTHKTYYYNGQLKSIVNYNQGDKVGKETHYDLLGKVKDVKMYFEYDRVQSLADLEYFISFKEVYKHFYSSYEFSYPILYRKPDGWYIKDPKNIHKEHLYWRFQNQEYSNTRLEFPTSKRYQSASSIKKKIEQDFSRQYTPTLFGYYENASNDIIELLSKEECPDSLLNTLSIAWRDQMEKAILEDKPHEFNSCFDKVKSLREIRLKKDPSSSFRISNGLAFSALKAKSMNNQQAFNKIIPLINYSNETKELGAILLSEYDESSLILRNNMGGFYLGLQLTESKHASIKLAITSLMREEWYYNYIQKRFSIQLKTPFETYKKRLKVTHSESTQKSYDINDLLDIINTESNTPIIQLPIIGKQIIIKTDNDTYTTKTVKKYSTIHMQGHILELDFLSSYIHKYPESKIYSQNKLYNDFKTQEGAFTTLILSDNAYKVASPNANLKKDVSLALQIHSVPEELNYLHHSYLLLIYRASDSDKHKKLLDKYMTFFGKDIYQLPIHNRYYLIESLLRYPDTKHEADQFIKATLELDKDSPNYNRYAYRKFKEDIQALLKKEEHKSLYKKQFHEEYKKEQAAKKVKKDDRIEIEAEEGVMEIVPDGF